MAAISRSHLPNLCFEPYLINIRCSLSLKCVIQLKVPQLKSHFLRTVGVLNLFDPVLLYLILTYSNLTYLNLS